MSVNENYFAEALQALRFDFNPFEHLEASADSRLSEYLITDELPASVWRDGSLTLYAPHGGGKTALRLFATRISWASLGVAHPLPVPIVLGGQNRPILTEFPEHNKMLVRAIIRSLFIGLAYRPEQFQRLQLNEQLKLAGWFAHLLPLKLQYYLAILGRRYTPDDLSTILDRSYMIRPLPPSMQVAEYCQKLVSLNSSAQTSFPALDWEIVLTELVDLVLNRLDLSTIHFLIDGVDSYYGADEHPELAITWFQGLNTAIKELDSSKLYLKYFLPTSMGAAFANSHVLPSNVVHLQWTPHRLTELIEKRLIISTSGRISSLDSLTGPDVENLGEQLFSAIPVLPRDALVVCKYLLAIYVQNGYEPLTSKHIADAIEHYHQDIPVYN